MSERFNRQAWTLEGGGHTALISHPVTGFTILQDLAFDPIRAQDSSIHLHGTHADPYLHACFSSPGHAG